MAVVDVRRHTRVAPTREAVVRNCRYWLQRNPSRRLYVYRVSGHWMHTGESLEVVQAKYRVRVFDYEEVVL